MANNPWQDPSAPQPGFSLPVSIGPMAIPVQKPQRKWRGILAWSLCVFAGGVAVGPILHDYAYQGIDAGAGAIAQRWPKLLGSYQPNAPEFPPTPPQRIAAPEAAAVERAAAGPAPVAAKPAPAPEPVAAEQVAAREPERAAETEHGARPARGRGGKVSAPAPAAPVVAAAEPPAAPARKGKYHDPFDSGGGEAAPAPSKREAKPAPEPAAKREAKPAPEPPAPKSPPAGKPGKADALDNLMADVPTDGPGGKGKGKHSTSRDIDAMLKDVQKSEPAPAPKKVESAELPKLTPGDITKAMAVVKTRASACSKRLGGSGVAELKLTVGKDGKVTDASLGGKLAGSPLGDCVEKAAHAAVFPPNAGLKFDYRVDVH